LLATGIVAESQLVFVGASKLHPLIRLKLIGRGAPKGSRR